MKLCCVTFAIILYGCYEEPAAINRHDRYKDSTYLVDNRQPIDNLPQLAYHRYTGPDYHQNYYAYSYMNQPDYAIQNIRFQPAPNRWQGHMGFHAPALNQQRVQMVHHATDRVNARRDELNRVMHELDREQQNLQAELSMIQQEHERSRQIIAMEYNRYFESMRSMASMQVNYPPEVIYVNAYPPPVQYASIPAPAQRFIHSGVVQPFSFESFSQPQPVVQSQVFQVTQPVVQQVQMPVIELLPETSSTTPAPPIIITVPPPDPIIVTVPPQIVYVTTPAPPPTIIVDHAGHIASLLQFIDTCLHMARQSPRGNTVISQLETIRASVAALQPTGSSSSLTAYSTQVNSLLPIINRLPRKTISEVWVDPLRVSSRGERDKLDKLVVQETAGLVKLSDTSSGGDREEEFNSATSIPNMFSLATNQGSLHHRLKVMRDHSSRQIKIIATCYEGRFKRKSNKERWFVSFTCDDSASSLVALTDRGRNNLTRAVLKVVCHSKDLARRLALDKSARGDRCAISRWTNIARGLSEPKFFALDRRGKNAWRALMDGVGCFSKNESEINARCRVSGGSKRSSR